MALLYEEESHIIRGSCYDIYKQFRNHHKEIIYHNALHNDLVAKGLKVEKNKRINIFYQDKKVGVYIPDLVIDNVILLELKCKPQLSVSDLGQFWHYLKCSHYKLGFLINFGASDGVRIERRIYDKNSL